MLRTSSGIYPQYTERFGRNQCEIGKSFLFTSNRRFFLEIYKKNNELHYLIPTKIENQKFGPCGPEYTIKDDEAIKIWRALNRDDPDTIAVSHRGSAGNYHIEIHPDYKHKERELFRQIEKLEKEHGSLDWRVALRIAEEVAKQKFCKFENEAKAMETDAACQQDATHVVD